MFPDKFLEVLQHEGVVSIITLGATPTAVTNTWNSYIKQGTDCLYIPAAGMHSIEEGLALDNQLKLTLGSKEVEGAVGPGAGFHVTGQGFFLTEGSIFEEMKATFPWLTRVLEVKVQKVEQKI